MGKAAAMPPTYITEICKIETNKKKYLDLLLLADEQESMIDRYLERGDMFVMFNTDLEPVSSAVVTDHNINEKVTESKWWISYVNVMQTNSNI